MNHAAVLCKVATDILANPQAAKRPFSRIVHHSQHCAVCNPKLVAASVATAVFSPRLLEKLLDSL